MDREVHPRHEPTLALGEATAFGMRRPARDASEFIAALALRGLVAADSDWVSRPQQAAIGGSRGG